MNESQRAAALRLWTAGEYRFDAQLVLLVDAMRRFHRFSARDHLEVFGWAVASVLLRVFMLWFAMLAMGPFMRGPNRSATAR